MTQPPTRDAVRECAEWLATCIRLGWRHEDLDRLEALWWKYHDANGKLTVHAPTGGAGDTLVMPRRKCIVCRQREAVVPDRNRAPSRILRVCRECHAARLQDDLREVLRQAEARSAARGGFQ